MFIFATFSLRSRSVYRHVQINFSRFDLPSLEKASDTDGMIGQNALYCIKRICIACNYKDINHMIEANLDYVIDSICSRLNFLSAYPTTPRVIRSVVIHTVGVEGSTNALLKEIVQTLLNALDREISQKSNFSFSASSNTLSILLNAVEDLMVCLDKYTVEQKSAKTNATCNTTISAVKQKLQDRSW